MLLVREIRVLLSRALMMCHKRCCRQHCRYRRDGREMVMDSTGTHNKILVSGVGLLGRMAMPILVAPILMGTIVKKITAVTMLTVLVMQMKKMLICEGRGNKILMWNKSRGIVKTNKAYIDKTSRITRCVEVLDIIRHLYKYKDKRNRLRLGPPELGLPHAGGRTVWGWDALVIGVLHLKKIKCRQRK